jgi:hypothetical protein
MNKARANASQLTQDQTFNARNTLVDFSNFQQIFIQYGKSGMNDKITLYLPNFLF